MLCFTCVLTLKGSMKLRVMKESPEFHADTEDASITGNRFELALFPYSRARCEVN